jgi:hypothetical protein
MLPSVFEVTGATLSTDKVKVNQMINPGILPGVGTGWLGLLRGGVVADFGQQFLCFLQFVDGLVDFVFDRKHGEGQKYPEDGDDEAKEHEGDRQAAGGGHDLTFIF